MSFAPSRNNDVDLRKNATHLVVEDLSSDLTDGQILKNHVKFKTHLQGGKLRIFYLFSF